MEVVKEDVLDISEFKAADNSILTLADHITVLSFLGKEPNEKAITALNLKELIYDKFKGFKRFQVVVLVHESAEVSVVELEKELTNYEELKYWHFAYGDDSEIQNVYQSLKTKGELNENLASDEVFIIDKERMQRGRIDDRSENEKKREAEVYGLPSYNCIEVAELKNKMGEDMRILFTEYRQKRKGNFNSSSRREQDLKNHEQN